MTPSSERSRRRGGRGAGLAQASAATSARAADADDCGFWPVMSCLARRPGPLTDAVAEVDRAIRLAVA